MNGARAAGRARGGLLACALVLVLVLGLAPRAAATTCARPDVLDTVPPDQATVPPNASLFAHYDSSADYGNEDVILTPPGGGAEGFTHADRPDVVDWDGTQGLLKFTPPEAFPPGDYQIEWPALRGLNTAALGKGAVVHFTVGTVDDVAAPTFAGLTGVAWDLERQTNDCTDSLENRMVFTLALAPADDDGGRAGLTLVVFQSAGSGSVDGGGSAIVLTTAMPAAGKNAAVKLPVADATGHVCFAAIARDLTGKFSTSGNQTVCTDTTAPPFFRGCSVAGAGARDAGGGAFALLALAVATLYRRRGRAG